MSHSFAQNIVCNNVYRSKSGGRWRIYSLTSEKEADLGKELSSSIPNENNHFLRAKWLQALEKCKISRRAKKRTPLLPLDVGCKAAFLPNEKGKASIGECSRSLSGSPSMNLLKAFLATNRPTSSSKYKVSWINSSWFSVAQCSQAFFFAPRKKSFLQTMDCFIKMFEQLDLAPAHLAFLFWLKINEGIEHFIPPIFPRATMFGSKYRSNVEVVSFLCAVLLTPNECVSLFLSIFAYPRSISSGFHFIFLIERQAFQK